MHRANVVFGHLSQQSGEHSTQLWAHPTGSALGLPTFTPSDDDVVIVQALRTPVCKAARGGFKDSLPDDLLSAAFTALINDVGFDPTLIDDICVGNTLQPGAGASMARIAQFFSHIPETVPIHTVNRFCSSGLQACMNIASSIKAGNIDVGIGAGVESMSVNSMHKEQAGFVLNPKIQEVEKAMQVLMPMGITSENVAERYGITRQQQDQMSMESHVKAANAQKNGWFDEEIIGVNTIIKDKNGNETPIRVVKDDGIRPGTTMEILGKLKPVFKKGGSTTAGNASQLSDGAAAVLLARRSAARKHEWPVFGVLRGFAVVGVPPDVMGIGPAYAIPAALKKAGLTVEDIDIYEINEAFASQAYYCVSKLKIPMEKVNPKGGGIGLGHPLGCTGARQIATLLHELKRRNKRAFGVVSMCIGSGMGAAAVFEYPGPSS